MKVFQSPVFWLVVVLLVAFGIGVLMKSARNREPGFQDYVKNPHLWSELVEKHHDVDQAIAAADNWSDQELTMAVHQFVFQASSDKETGPDLRVLRSLGTRTHAVLLQILRDPSVRSKLLKQKKGEGLPKAPFNRVCDLLDENPPTEAASLIAPFLDEPEAEIRKSAAIALGSIGSESVVSPVRKALQDSDDYVRSYALMGLERASNGQRLCEACRRELFADLQRLLSEGKNGHHVAGLMLQFDQQRATEFFLSDPIFTPDSRSL